MAKRNSISAERIRELFDYNPATGLFTIRVTRQGGHRAGYVTGGYPSGAYLAFLIDGVEIKAHIVAWIWMKGVWPTVQIDHRNRKKRENWWANLREATKTQNAINVGLRRDNVSGARGVSWDKRRGEWTVRLRVGKKYLHLGYFAESRKDAAINAYKDAAQHHYGEFARTQ